MKISCIFLILLLCTGIDALSQNKDSDTAKKPSLEQRIKELGFKTNGKPQAEHILMIRLDKEGYTPEQIRKVVAEQKKQQKISYTLKSQKEQFKNFIYAPGKKKYS